MANMEETLVRKTEVTTPSDLPSHDSAGTARQVALRVPTSKSWGLIINLRRPAMDHTGPLPHHLYFIIEGLCATPSSSSMPDMCLGNFPIHDAFRSML